MRQLTALDAQFLSTESTTTAAHVAGVAILDGPISREQLLDVLRERIHLAPPLGMRIAQVPLGLDRPYWVQDHDFDVADHVHESTLAHPTQECLAEHLAAVHARRLDRSRPLWEMHLVHGLDEDRVALYTKVHHAAIDGVSAAEIIAGFLDLTPEQRVVTPPPATPREAAPTGAGLVAGALTRAIGQPIDGLRAAARAASDLDAIPLAASLPGARLVARTTRRLLGGKPMPDLPSLTAPRTPFDGPISGTRALAFGSIPLADVRHVATTFGMSVNDVIMTICATALRSWLVEHDALPQQPLIAAVPVAVRTQHGGQAIGNQISAMITPLPTDVATAEERLSSVRALMAASKRRFTLSRTTWLSDLCSVLPVSVSSRATPAVFRLASRVAPGVNLIVSNVPGPQFPLYLCGTRVLAYFPMSVLTDITGGLSVTCLSYDGNLDFGLVACPTRVPDVWHLMDLLRDAARELVKLADA